MTIQSPGAAVSTACWMDRNWPCLPCQLPTVHTLGLEPCPLVACAAVAAPLRPNVSRAATVPGTAIRRHEPEKVRQTRAEDVGNAVHPLARPAAAPMPRLRWHYPRRASAAHRCLSVPAMSVMPAMSVIEPEPAKLLRVPLPVLGDLNPQIQVDPRAKECLDLLPGLAADLPEPCALGTNDNGLLAWPLDVHDGVNVGESAVIGALGHLLDHDGDRVRQLVPYSLERGLADELGNQYRFWLVAHFACRIERPALGQVGDEHIGEHIKLVAGDSRHGHDVRPVAEAGDGS